MEGSAAQVLNRYEEYENGKKPRDSKLLQDMSLKSSRSSRQFDLGDASTKSFFSSDRRRTMVWTSTIPSTIGSAVLWPLKPLKKVMKGKKHRSPPEESAIRRRQSLNDSSMTNPRPSLLDQKIPEESMMLANIFDNMNVSNETNGSGDELGRTNEGNGRRRRSVLRYRKRLQEDSESSKEFKLAQSAQHASVPSSLLATGRSVSISSLQNSFEVSRSTSFKQVVESTNSDEAWNHLVKPFVSDLAFCSIVTRRSESAVCFDPHTCEAAVLFVDLSGYSKITAAIAHKGAHAISSAVNAYLDRLLHIIDKYGGDVIKFAGDAVLVVWAGEDEGDDDELEYNLLCASKCALELQKQCGVHPVAGTQHAFQIHVGLCCGIIESEIFAAPSHAHMQRLFHSLSGQCLKDISELVDLAKSGEIAISTDVADYLGTRGIFEDIDGVLGALKLTDLELEPILEEAMDQHIADCKKIRAKRRLKGAEEDFIHPNVLRLLRYGGLTPTQIAQMRNLCVLFIAQTSSGNSVNWLMEVQGVLDRYRCPIIQIIDDDKGTHVVAAVNLCESVPESAVLGLDACRDLVKKQIGCAIGVAMGSTFCGVTGSAHIACRWDITGPHPVRAARLMQYALLNKVEVAIDSSLLEDPMAATRMTILDPVVEIKGSPEPCTVYGLSGSKIYSVFRVLENATIGGNVQTRAVNQVRKCLNTGRTRCAVILTGAPFTGKKSVCRTAAALSEFVPFTHVCNETAGLAQLARTIAIWYLYVKSKKIRKQAQKVLDHMDNARFSKAHDECVEMVFDAVDEGLRACFVVDRIQFLDSFSLSIMRGCLEGRSQRGSEGSGSGIVRIDGTIDQYAAFGNSSDSERFSLRPTSTRGSEYRKGKVVFLGCHLPLYNRKSAEELKDDITRSRRTFRVKVVEVGEPSLAEMRSLIREKFDLEPDQRWLRCHAEASGVSLAYFLERAKAIHSNAGDAHESKGRDMVTDTLTLHIPPGYIQRCQQCPLSEVSADMAMKTLQLFDDLPPLFQTLTKVIAIATRKALFKIPSIVVWKVMNDLYGELDSDRFGVCVGEMKEMHLLKVVVDKNMDKLSFVSPIVADVAMSTCTPSQIRYISEALLYRLESMMMHEFKVPLVMADLYHELRRNEDKKKECWKKAYKSFLKLQKEEHSASGVERDWWMEYFSDVVTLAGYSPTKVFGKDFVAPAPIEKEAPAKILELKAYCAPITLGPLGHTLSVLSRHLFKDYGASIREDDDEKAKIRELIAGARRRYFKEINVIERFLRETGLEAEPAMLEAERTLLFELTTSSLTGDEVLAKAEHFLDNLVKEFVQPRLERIRDCVTFVSGVPDVIKNCNDEALYLAYKKIVHGKCWKDKTEDALMALAVNNWRPRPVPECATLPLSHLQTICQIRDKFLKQKAVRNGDEMSGYQEYLFSDFQAFLINTAILYNAMDAEQEDFLKPKLMRNRSSVSGCGSSIASFGSLAQKIDEDDNGSLDEGDNENDWEKKVKTKKKKKKKKEKEATEATEDSSGNPLEESEEKEDAKDTVGGMDSEGKKSQEDEDDGGNAEEKKNNGDGGGRNSEEKTNEGEGQPQSKKDEEEECIEGGHEVPNVVVMSSLRNSLISAQSAPSEYSE